MQRVEVRDEAGLAPPLVRDLPVRPLHLPLAERRVLVAIGDVAALVIALSVARGDLGRSSETLFSSPTVWLATLIVTWLVVAPAFDAYEPARVGNPLSSALAGGQAALATMAIYFLTPYLSAPLLTSRALMLLFGVTLFGTIVGWRALFALGLRRLVAPRRVLVVGTGQAAATIAGALGGDSDVHFVGYVDGGADDRAPGEEPLVLGGRADLWRLVQSRAVSDLVVSEPSRMHADLVKAVVRAYESGVNVMPMAALYEELTGRIPVEHIGDDWIGALPQLERLRGLGSLAKRALDIVGGAVGAIALVLLAPFIALAIRADSPGPIFFSQERVGYRGRRFAVWKFRSMVDGAEADGRARWATPRDPRVTHVGRFLRATRLDELPQVLNVLRGEMSIVGPRPERPEFVGQLEQQIPFYRARLLVKPGLTGWAQIKYGYGGSADDALVKLQYDLYYVKHRSVLLDALIIAKTIPVVLRLRGT